MALINMLTACLATWLPLHVLPDNARALWRRAEIARLVAMLPERNVRRVASADRFTRPMLRRPATESVAVAESLIKEFGGYVERNWHNPDPEVQQTIQAFFVDIKHQEGDLLWYRGILIDDAANPR